jgi:hypothetical protein
LGYQRGRIHGLELASDYRSRGEIVSHSWGFLRTLSMQMEYQHSHQSVELEDEPDRPTDTHVGRLSLEWRKRISRTRTISFGGGSGAMRVSTTSVLDDRPFDYVVPSYSGRVRLDIGRTWAVSLDTRRDASVIEGVSQQSFLTDVGTLWLGGNIGSTPLPTAARLLAPTRATRIFYVISRASLQDFRHESNAIRCGWA